MNIFVISPYVGVNSMLFGMSRTRARVMLGKPTRERRSRCSLEVTDSWQPNNLQLTFSSPVGELLEISLYPGIGHVSLLDIDVFAEPRDRTYTTICRQDKSPLQTVGVTVLLSLGVSLTGFLHHDADGRSISAFAQGRWSAQDPSLSPLKLPLEPLE
ncbi:hypothetical protein [Ideonella sp. A 288]|uniref:hypothetical protein n=1 Tax=Ideonella sp. A 288 TaxID=1962181 RepID=UPI001185B507|nr:hypothetical protein [Ideonella sp. A 288]